MIVTSRILMSGYVNFLNCVYKNIHNICYNLSTYHVRLGIKYLLFIYLCQKGKDNDYYSIYL